MLHGLLRWLGDLLARFLSGPSRLPPAAFPVDPTLLAAALRPGDVLLVEGTRRISTAVKYLTQSTWSHATLYVGDALGPPPAGSEPLVFIEADMVEGVRPAPLSEYVGMHTRICRPVGLQAEDVQRVIDYAVARLGHRYDLKNLIDLARYLLPIPPVPSAWRRRMLALGSGDPTRAVCSTLIAQAFQSVRYPILPVITCQDVHRSKDGRCAREIYHIRHHSLFVPRDFDVSPYFRIVKPTVEAGFDHRMLTWHETPLPPDEDVKRAAPAAPQPQREPASAAFHPLVTTRQDGR